MSENNKKNNEKNVQAEENTTKEKVENVSVEDKLKETEDKLLRSLAEIENQK